MSISQRINKETKVKLNELQANIVLIKKKKLSITELLDKIISFSIKNTKEFLDFLFGEEQSDNDKTSRDDFLDFILSPIEGAGPEDFKEYNYNED